MIRLEVHNLEDLRQRLEELEKLKKDLLEHYASREPKSFFQYDGFVVGIDFDDDIMRPDKDGDWVSAHTTQELMHGADVRVFVNPRISEADALRLLKKIAAWVRRDGFIIDGEKVIEATKSKSVVD